MPEVTEHAPGSFCWMELATSDSAAAKKFYSSVFGWESVDSPAGPDMVYTMLQIGGKDIGALFQENTPGVPPHWSSYISVKSADESAAKAKSLGGTVMAEPFDVMDVGRMAVVQDPLGAVFCVWQPRKHFGSKLVGELNTFCWDELNTTDSRKAMEFYTKLFGWDTKTNEGPMKYTEWINNGMPIGGMMEITPEMGPVPPNWLPYIAVQDCDATAEKAKSLGANFFLPPTDIPDVGRFAVIQDPQGAVFAIVKLSRMGS
jgi:uncharacterized protein